MSLVVLLPVGHRTSWQRPQRIARHRWLVWQFFLLALAMASLTALRSG